MKNIIIKAILNKKLIKKLTQSNCSIINILDYLRDLTIKNIDK